MYQFEKYACTKETMKDRLKMYGVAILPVLNSTECRSLVSGLWDFLEHISSQWETPIRQQTLSTWREFYKLYPLHSMLIQHWGVGHIQASWDVRQNTNVAEVFAHFWECKVEDLLVSFDGISFNLPPEVTHRGWNRKHTWYHTDQSYTTPDFKCIQGWITGMDVNDGDATLSILEGSHMYHDEFRQHFQVTDTKDWYKLNEEQEQFYLDKGCTYNHIRCPKGSLVVWDSRTIHCGIEASRERSVPNLRAVIYVCYMPRSHATEKQLEKKRIALKERRTTTHDPCNVKLFPKIPRTYGGSIHEVRAVYPPVLNDLGQRLAGM